MEKTKMRIALITGANRGIGLAIATGLNGLGGIRVLVGSRRAEDGENTARALDRVDGGNHIQAQEHCVGPPLC